MRNAGIIAMTLSVASQLAPQTRIALAQRPSAVTSFRHASTIKSVESLEWAGLYEQLEPYRRWWQEIATCAGIPLPSARPDSVQFFYINAPDFAPTPTDKPGRMVSGVTYAAREQIFMSVLQLRNEKLVKHEMLHQLLYWWGEVKWDDDARVEFTQCGVQAAATDAA